jgi:hypothetical protein
MGVDNITSWASSSGDGSIGYDVMVEVRQSLLSLPVIRAISAWISGGDRIVVAFDFGTKVRCPRGSS